MRKILTVCCLLLACMTKAQIITDDANRRFTATGYQEDKNFGRSDSIQSQHKEIPRGMKVWTIDELFGDRTEAEPDTASHMFMNTAFTSGLRGEFNTLGNLGSPRINRIYIDRPEPTDFFFTAPYDFFITEPGEFHFTNTLSPITNLSYYTCGNRQNGEDHFKALFAVNAGKKLGLGMKIDYIYGRGYYSNQNTSHFNYTLYGSYLGDRYQAHLLAYTNHQKVSENGGISNDDYITHPEQFNTTFEENEIPTFLRNNWNRNDNQQVFFNQRYSVGFSRKVPMTEDEINARKFAMKSQQQYEAAEAKRKAQEKAKRDGVAFDEKEYERQLQSTGRPVEKDAAQGSNSAGSKSEEEQEWMKTEYVPVTSFIHTANFRNFKRIFQANNTPADYYLNDYGTGVGGVRGDSIFDKTRHWQLTNTLAVALLEGFNKWAKAGLKAFASYDIRHYSLPNMDNGYESFNEQSLHIGGQLSKAQGKTLHYNITGDLGVTGNDAGEFCLDANADLNFRLFGDTVQLAANAVFHKHGHVFYYEHYHSRHFWWDQDELDDIFHSHLEGSFSLKRTRSQLRVAVDAIKNYTYLSLTNNRVATGDSQNRSFLQTQTDIHPEQADGPINVLTLQLRQDFKLGIFNWQNEITYQRSSHPEILAVPALNIYSNLFMKFKIAHVLDCDFGADMRFFTKYYAPEYSPALGQFVVQANEAVRVKTGAYPIVNVYANFFLKHARFFVMYSHVNYSQGNKYIFTPHYPENQSVLRFGISWNFFN